MKNTRYNTSHTNEEMLRTGIYQIRNTLNNKTYVGSAARSFRHRWSIHLSDLRANKHHSIVLQRAYIRYGESAFVFEILEFCDPEKCLSVEQSYLDTKSSVYNAYWTAGSPLGVKRSPATIQAHIDRKARYEYVIEKPDGEYVVVRNLNKFAKTNKVPFAILRATLFGQNSRGHKVFDCRGYIIHARMAINTKTGELLPNEPVIYRPKDIVPGREEMSERGREAISRAQKHRKRTQEVRNVLRAQQSQFEYKIQTPNGEIVTTTSAKQFAEEHGLNHPTLLNTLRGHDSRGNLVYAHKGYIILSRTALNDTESHLNSTHVAVEKVQKGHSDETKSNLQKKRQQFVYTVQFPDGTVQQIDSIKYFCQEQGLDQAALRLTLPNSGLSYSNQRTHTKGYKLLTKSPIAKAAIDA